jgi:hypothetical protein
MKPVLKTGLGLHRFQVNRFKPNRFQVNRFKPNRFHANRFMSNRFRVNRFKPNRLHLNRSLNRFETGLETDFDENTKLNFFTK